MPEIAVEITKFVDESQPGWVECCFTDANGEEQRFIEKVPVFTAECLDGNSSYPQRGFIACTVLKRKVSKGKEYVEIDTSKPWGIESVKGECRFAIAADLLIETKI